MTPDELARTMRAAIASGSLDLPPLGGGASPQRLAGLSAIGRADLTVARVAEAHVDAVQVLREAGRRADDGCWYAVWAAEEPGGGLRLRREGGRLVLEGTKPFCSGAGLVDRALVTARTEATPRPLLLDVAVAPGTGSVSTDHAAWVADAFAATRTGTVTFERAGLSDDDIVGAPGWYLDRPGFWHGACGPAACWAGGAQGLADVALAQLSEGTGDDRRPLHDEAMGALAALAFQNEALLTHAGRCIDEDPADTRGARVRALQVRQCVERTCSAILDRVGRALGPRPLAFHAEHVRRVGELTLYLRQCHAERDLAALGAELRTAAS